MYENSEIWEGQFIEVTEIAKNKSVIIGKKKNGRNGSFFTWLATS